MKLLTVEISNRTHLFVHYERAYGVLSAVSRGHLRSVVVQTAVRFVVLFAVSLTIIDAHVGLNQIMYIVYHV